MSFITMQQMYQSWLDIINRVEQVKAKLDAGIDVADADTLAELEAIKTAINGTLSVQDADMLAELTAVKAKLEAIEQRLDETFDVKLTGSNVELLGTVASLEIPAGTTVTFLENVDISKYNHLFVQLLPLGSTKYSIVMRPRRVSGPTMTSVVLFEQTNSSVNIITDRIEVCSLRADFALRNNLEEDHDYGEINVFGVRA